MMVYASMLSEPAIVAALVSVLVALLTPWVSEKIRERTQGRLEAASVAVRKLDSADRFHDALQARLEATEAENDALQEKMLRLERVVFAWDTRFSAISGDIARIRTALEAERPEIQVVLEMLTRVIDTIQRREHADRERTG